MKVNIVNNISSLNKSYWHRIEDPHFPFSDYDFLAALEKTNCLGDNTGWYPRIVLAESSSGYNGALIGFLKTNSYGEYIFDWQWARAYQDYGVPYYPKLTSAIPFTPATGSKLLCSPSSTQADKTLILEAYEKLFELNRIYSSHHLFIPQSQLDTWQNLGYTQRHSYQFHWHNRDYQNFTDFLNSLQGKRRRQIQKERREVQSEDLKIERLSGDKLHEGWGSIFYEFYCTTIDKKGAIPYLSEGFFREVFRTMKDRLVLVCAREADELIAVSLAFFKGAKIFGRYWGAKRQVPHLHFELCYYQLIEFAIERNLKLFEAGAQGEHKIQRGFIPQTTYSMHRLKHPQFAEVITRYIEDEKKAVQSDCLYLAKSSPYKVTLN